MHGEKKKRLGLTWTAWGKVEVVEPLAGLEQVVGVSSWRADKSRSNA